MRFDRYEWSGGGEAMMRLGPDVGSVAMIVPPLFEEANRTRAIVTAMLRALVVHGIAGALPDLPGQGDSLLPTDAMTLSMLREAVAAAVRAIAAEGRAVYVVAVRSGALLDHLAPAGGRWHLSPQDGDDLLRELTRIKQHEVGRERTLSGTWLAGDAAPDHHVSIAGNPIARAFLAQLPGAGAHVATDTPRRIVRLGNDPRPADTRLVGAPPWRRAEPGNDDALAQVLADDLAAWIARCGG